ncbi:guanine nucleotide exchange factor synembryn-domain-containing protein [Chaetomium fimeti]|uniref:Guanine nucleotide exchange factor synembryn-domain-containing protein n=1 Tax=Chaetomium fimeti TaxID=1854472 RepID=A0AAE0HP78_9PEZI|nr:guanine nucleotide exchange factor synembryn-domain-containing protein [Chaetomium fimeti]
MAQLTGPAKLDAVRKLFDLLAKDLTSGSLQPRERDAALEELKLYGRDPNYADPIFTKEGIEILAKFAFDSSSDTTCRNALKVLCNTLFIKEQTRQILVDLGYEPKACDRLKNDSRDDEFLISRVILLSTYGTNLGLPKLIEQHQLADSMVAHLSRHASRLSAQPSVTGPVNPMEGMALDETLKLLFNVTNFAKEHINSFDGALPHVASILSALPLPQAKAPLDPPFSLLIAPLLNLDLTTPTAQASLYPPAEPSRIASRLLQLLDLSMKSYNDTQIEATVTPLLCALSVLYEHAPTETDTTTTPRSTIRTTLLPREEDRKTVLGRADTLASRLLRNWTNPLAPQFRSAVAHFYFDLSGKDAVRFIENVGYGYASGFLFENNISIPEGAMQGQGQVQGGGEGDDDEAGEGESAAGRRAVNPITGQFLDEERFPDLPEMTMEEKEREAERLFVLFERLRQTGVVSVENPATPVRKRGRPARAAGTSASARLAAKAASKPTRGRPKSTTTAAKPAKKAGRPKKDATDEEAPAGEYEVESIADSAIDADTMEHMYFVKWKNYPASENTWEPKKNLKGSLDLVRKFDAAKKKAEAAEAAKKATAKKATAPASGERKTRGAAKPKAVKEVKAAKKAPGRPGRPRRTRS